LDDLAATTARSGAIRSALFSNGHEVLMSEDGDVLVRIDDPEPNTPEEYARRIAADRAETARLDQRVAESQAEIERHRASIAAAEAYAARNQIGAALSSVERDEQDAQGNYRDAMERADYDSAARAQSRISESAARRVQLEQQRDAVERQASQPVDSFERYASQCSAPTANWMREHKDWITDPDKFAEVQAAHFHAIAKKVKVDTPEYFEHVEKRIRLRGDDTHRAGGMNIVKHKKLPEQINPNDANTHLLGPNRVYLTKGEREKAEDGTLVWSTGPLKGTPLGLQEYARRKIKLIQQGAYRRLD
jgi:hypothetical protein